MNCKFKFHLRAALYRGAAGRWAPLKWAGLPAVPVGLRRIGWALPGRWGSAGLVEALPDRWGAAELDGREPGRPAASFFRIFWSAVRARKPSSLALRAGGREPSRPASRVQMKRDARKAPCRPPCISSHYYFSKRKELTTNSHSRLVVVNFRHFCVTGPN